jgi:TolB-like protein/DNA-binding winged helix-turn-helix (wHTH) protein/Tfp pilus assembly protein PilF
MTQNSAADASPIFAFGPFRLDVAERRVERDGAEIALTSKTFDLLLTLIEGAGRLRTREALIQALWPDTIVEEHSLTWHLSSLRRALGDTGSAPQYIETVRGHGYRFIAPVEDVSAREASTASPTVPFETLVAARAAEPAAVQPSSLPDGSVAARPDRHRFVASAAALVVLALGAGLAIAFAFRPPKATIAPALSAAPAVARHSLAVMPFENLSTDPGNAYFVSGTEDFILAKLAGIADLRVVSRRSTETYGSRPADLRAIARELDVDAVLEGSVQKAGDRVLIAVQLISPASGEHLWGQAYTRTLDDVFEIERDVAEQVSGALKARLLPAEAARVANVPTRDTQAYDAFLRAEYVASGVENETAKDPVAATAEARRHYEDAITHDPDFALAHARLSYLLSRAYWYDIDHSEATIAKAEAEANRATALDPGLPDSMLAMAYIHYYAHRDYAAALDQLERARVAWPSNSDIDAAIGSINRRQGRWEEAIAGMERAIAYDPRNPRWPSLLGDTLAVLRRYDDAGKAYDRAQAADPDDISAAIYKSLGLLLSGQLDEAHRALDALPSGVDPGGVASTLRFEVARTSGDPDAALAAIEHAPEWVEAPYAPAFAPIELLRAEALEQKGDADGAKAAYATARDKLRVLAREQPENPGVFGMLGLAEAGVGERENALRNAQHATTLLPVATDALDGPAYVAIEAEVRLRTGDEDGAIKLLRDVLAMPAGRILSAPRIERDPRFASVRDRVLR